MSEFRDMRRKRQQLSDEESIGILQKATSGTLALLGDNGNPYAVPISYVYSEGMLYFHSALSGHKVDAIKNHDKASFCVIDKDEVKPENRLLGNRYNTNQEGFLQKEIKHGFSRMLAIRFGIEHLTGKEAIELVKTA